MYLILLKVVPELDGAPIHNENKCTPTEPIHSAEMKKSTDNVSNRTISIQSRAADDENSSHSDGKDIFIVRCT